MQQTKACIQGEILFVNFSQEMLDTKDDLVAWFHWRHKDSQLPRGPQRPFAVPHPQIDCRTLQLPPLLAVSAPSGWKIGRAFTRTAIWSQVEQRETQPSVPDQGPQGHDFLCRAVAKPFLPSVMWTALMVHSVDVEHLAQEWLNVEEGCHLPDQSSGEEAATVQGIIS